MTLIKTCLTGHTIFPISLTFINDYSPYIQLSSSSKPCFNYYISIGVSIMYSDLTTHSWNLVRHSLCFQNKTRLLLRCRHLSDAIHFYNSNGDFSLQEITLSLPSIFSISLFRRAKPNSIFCMCLGLCALVCICKRRVMWQTRCRALQMSVSGR